MTGGNKKVKNAKKVDMNGDVILMGIPAWKKLHPNEIYFDSYLEYYFWRLLIDNKIDFELKAVFEIYKPQRHLYWGYHEDHCKILKDAHKGDNTPSEKAATTRWFKTQYSKCVAWINEPGAKWKPDFYLPKLKTYVDTKGHITAKDWRFKYKALIEKLSLINHNIIILQTQEDCRGFINYLKEKEKYE